MSKDPFGRTCDDRSFKAREEAFCTAFNKSIQNNQDLTDEDKARLGPAFAEAIAKGLRSYNFQLDNVHTYDR